MKHILGSFFGAVLFLSSAHAQQHAPIKCEASVNGYKIHSVYVMGDQPSGVAWAYKNLANETCLTPTLDIEKADAVLEVHRIWVPGSPEDTAPLSVSCSSGRNSTICDDSAGNQMIINCTAGVCSSYYGPSLSTAIGGALREWISTRWYESDTRLYTPDRKLLWKSEDQKGDWLGAGWIDKVRLGTSSPVCKVGAWSRSKYKTFRHWASTTCGVEFDPLVSIDLKLVDRQAVLNAKRDEKDTMLQNAHDATLKKNAATVTQK